MDDELALNCCILGGGGGLAFSDHTCFISSQLRLRCDVRPERRLRGPVGEERENGRQANSREAVQEEGALEAAHHRGTRNE